MQLVSAMRVVSGSGGWPNGMVQLQVGAVCVVVPHAKQPVRAEGLGSNAGVGVFCRRPIGNGCGSQMKRRDLLLFVNRLRAGVR